MASGDPDCGCCCGCILIVILGWIAVAVTYIALRS